MALAFKDKARQPEVLVAAGPVEAQRAVVVHPALEPQHIGSAQCRLLLGGRQQARAELLAGEGLCTYRRSSSACTPGGASA